MGENIQFAASEFNVAHDLETGEMLRLMFFGRDDVVTIYTPRDLGPLLVDELQRVIAHSKAEPLDSGELEKGGVIQQIAEEIRPLEDGSVLWTVHLRTDDGTRSLPLHITPDQLRNLTRHLNTG